MIEALIISHVVLWVLVIALAAVTFALARQIGVLHERSAPLGALLTDHGPALGQPAPVLTAVDLQGHPVQLGGRSAAGRSTLFFFLSPSCPMCKKLLPAVKSLARRERDTVDVVLMSDGEREEHERFVKEQHLHDFPYLLARELGVAYRIGRLPYAVLLDQEGVTRAMGVVNTREHLESLLIAQETGQASLQDYLKGKRASHTAAPDGASPRHLH